MVVGEGFEPSKSVTADLQSAPFGRLGIPPTLNCLAVRDSGRNNTKYLRCVKCYFKKKRSTALKISALLNCCAISY